MSDDVSLPRIPGFDGVAERADGSSPLPSRRRLQALFWGAVALTVLLPFIPYGRLVVYPFALLGVWAHEMGHGVMAVLVGGRFIELEIYRNLGGVAYTSGTGSLGGALVSAAGLLGPAILGGVVVVYGARPRTARWVLGVLAVVVLVSVVFVVRNTFGVVAMTLIGLALGAIGFWGPQLVRIGLAQLVGIQLAMTSLGTVDYMFTRDFVRDGRVIDSDTQNIADVLLLPYWFWGGVIAALSVMILGFAFHQAWIKPVGRSTTPVSS